MLVSKEYQALKSTRMVCSTCWERWAFWPGLMLKLHDWSPFCEFGLQLGSPTKITHQKIFWQDWHSVNLVSGLSGCISHLTYTAVKCLLTLLKRTGTAYPMYFYIHLEHKPLVIILLEHLLWDICVKRKKFPEASEFFLQVQTGSWEACLKSLNLIENLKYRNPWIYIRSKVHSLLMLSCTW